MNKNFIRISCSLILFYGFGLICDRLERAVATEVSRTAPIVSNTGVNKQTVKKPKFPDRGVPRGRRRGGTSRSECSGLDRSLTAIVPGRETKQSVQDVESIVRVKFDDSESFLSKTLKKYPTFWIYVPELANSPQAEFIVQDERDRDIYRTFFDLPGKSGIFDLKLPVHEQNALEIGQKYHWYVKVFCGEERESGYVFVDAWIERIAASDELQEQLNSKNANQAQILIERGIWHDAIDALARVRKYSLEQERWNQLLTSLGLSDLIDKRILNTRANFPVE